MSEDPVISDVFEIIKSTALIVHYGDLLDLPAEAIVCPIDADLSMHMGLAAVVRDNEGFDLKDRITRKHETLPVGDFAVVDAVRLNAKKIYFASVYSMNDSAIRKEIIQRLIRNVLMDAEMRLGLKSIAIPMLGSPTVKAPYAIISQVMVKEVVQFLSLRECTLKTVVLSLYNKESFALFREQMFYLRQPRP